MTPRGVGVNDVDGTSPWRVTFYNEDGEVSFVNQSTPIS